jgi:hypothetical protein
VTKIPDLTARYQISAGTSRKKLHEKWNPQAGVKKLGIWASARRNNADPDNWSSSKLFGLECYENLDRIG